MFKKWLVLVFMILLISSVWTQTVLSKQEIRDAWLEINDPSLLLEATSFLKGPYMQAFFDSLYILVQSDAERKYAYLLVNNSQPNIALLDTSNASARLTIYGGFLYWLVKFKFAHLATNSEIVNGQSPKYQIVVAKLPINDKIFAALQDSRVKLAISMTREEYLQRGKGSVIDTMNLSIYCAYYFSDRNQLVLDSRLRLSVALWMSVMFHEEWHAQTDIVFLKNQIPDFQTMPDSIAVNYELSAHLMSDLFWRIIRQDYLEKCQQLGLNRLPEYFIASLVISDLYKAEPLVKKFFQGEPEPYRVYIKRLYLD